MNTTNQQQESKTERLLHHIIIKKTFDILEAEGEPDRILAEKLAQEIIRRISQRKVASRALPGMESFVPKSVWDDTHIPPNNDK